jgi:hypothetical protein
MRKRRDMLQLDLILTDEEMAKAAAATREQKVAEFLRLCLVANKKKLKKGFIGNQFRATFSHWPRFTDDDLKGIEPAKQPFFPLRRRQG